MQLNIQHREGIKFRKYYESYNDQSVENTNNRVVMPMSNVYLSVFYQCRFFSLECRLVSEKYGAVLHVKCRVVSVKFRVVSVKCRVVSVDCRVVNMKFRLISVDCRVVGVKCRVISVDCRVVGVKIVEW